MAVLLKRKRIAANPHRKRRRNAAGVKRVNRRKNKHRMTPKQIRFFGTKAQRAALKRKRNRKNPARHVAVAPNRRRRRNARRRNRVNPAWVVTLGAINPRKRRNKPVAARKANRRHRRRNTTAVRRVNRHHRRRRNPVTAPRRRNRRRRNTVVHRNRRRRNSPRIVVMRPNRRHHRRRNPQALFGAPLFGKSALEMVGGGIVGVAAAKFIPTLFPASVTGMLGSSSIARVIITGVSAVVAGWAANKVTPQFGQGVLFGGMMQTVSVALNAFLPSVWTQLNPTLGDLLPGQFTVPQNPIRAAIAPPAPPVVPPASAQNRVGSMNGLARSYGYAF